MLTVCFYPACEVDDSVLRFAVIVSRYQGQWVFCRHRDRDTWEVPGGRREPGETILKTARRELYEETGAAAYAMRPVCVYSVLRETESYGMLFEKARAAL